MFVKTHGCAEHYREEISRAPNCGAENEIIIRRAQLLNWRTDLVLAGLRKHDLVARTTSPPFAPLEWGDLTRYQAGGRADDEGA